MHVSIIIEKNDYRLYRYYGTEDICEGQRVHFMCLMYVVTW